MGTKTEKPNPQNVYNVQLPFKTSPQMPTTFTPQFSMQYSVVVETPLEGLMGKAAMVKNMAVPTTLR